MKIKIKITFIHLKVITITNSQSFWQVVVHHAFNTPYGIHQIDDI
jgi:hypothetical protein